MHADWPAVAGLMLALHWPLDPDLWTLAFGRWSRRTLVAIGAGQFGAHPFSARDGARNPFDQPPTIQQPIRRIVETIVNGFSVKFGSPRLSILAGVRYRSGNSSGFSAGFFFLARLQRDRSRQAARMRVLRRRQSSPIVCHSGLEMCRHSLGP